ncbi:MAG: protein translocase subunit SecD [Acidimicrobiales bacterium]
MRRRLVLSLVGILTVAGGSLAAVLVAGDAPLLGLDLQGGASVVLQPVEDVPSENLDQAIEIIRTRVDALGVAEPEIARQGDSVVVQLPGVKDQQRALEVVGQTAELRFRPVLEVVPPGAGDVETTPRDEADPEVEVVLPDAEADAGPAAGRGVRYRLGPAAVRGNAVSDAEARFQQTRWTVTVDFTGEGNDAFNEIAGRCFNREPVCPTSRLAIVLDGQVVSSPSIVQPDFRGTAEITGDFSEGEAKDLALVLRFGALPVQLEPQTVQTVSATLGKDSLRAGLMAGIVGMALIAVYLLAYYRLLGLVAVVSLAVSGALLWSIISFLGERSGLALTLAGVTGIIVSIGVAVDSNIVYYERLKEEVFGGRPLHSASDRGFRRAFSTILRADAASLIGAALLYYFTVGPVRGFAFYLGLATMLDVVTSYFFMRPAVILLGRSGRLGRARAFGIPADAVGAAARP